MRKILEWWFFSTGTGSGGSSDTNGILWDGFTDFVQWDGTTDNIDWD